jgi:glycosyltransferase involved in cell wall biosynthesis
MLKQKLLIIGHTFPEPSTTGAGNRMMQLIELFLEEGYDITFASTANASERSVSLDHLGISVQEIHLNQTTFDTFIADLNPSVVMYDRFMTEEQFGWRVAECCPEALRILDTEDLHFLRKAREEAISLKIPIEQSNLYSEYAKRELASILRCDISLIISEYEMELLQHTFHIPAGILFYIPFIVEAPVKDQPSFEKRSDFMTIGNLFHSPNVDSIVYLKTEIWPLIKRELPESKIHIYGAYAPQKIGDLHNERDGFLIEGWVDHVSDVMRRGKVCLVPLRFGAGLKGKLLDAMRYGIPSVTTSIGAEGMYGDLPFAGFVEDHPKAFATSAIELYTDKTKWLESQQNGFHIINTRFLKTHFSKHFIQHIHSIKGSLMKHRRNHFLGMILHHKTLLSTKYMSKWIEEKNRKA